MLYLRPMCSRPHRCQSLSNRGSFPSWLRRPRTAEQCMAQAVFSGTYLGYLSLSQIPYQQQPLPLSKQVAAPRTSSGKSLRLQAHACNSQRAASKPQSPSHIVRKDLQAVNRRHHCSSSVGCLAQNCSDDRQVPGDGHGSVPASTPAAQGHPPFLKVPWDWKEVGSVLLLWLMSFWILGYWVLPTCLEFAGYSSDDLSSRGQALMHLIVDFGQLGLTVAILRQRLKAYRPLHLGWFRSYWQPIHKWLGPVIGAAVLFPLLASVAEQAQIWFPYDGDLWAQNLELQIMSGEPVSNMLYFVVLTCCAPIWEEAMFRGFLLPSLRKYMPMSASLVLTSIVFAMAHFSLQRFIPLSLLGLILGTVYLYSRSLAAPIMLHSLWNLYIFWNLLKRGAGI